MGSIYGNLSVMGKSRIKSQWHITNLYKTDLKLVPITNQIKRFKSNHDLDLPITVIYLFMYLCMCVCM